jgi:hypothetical protein
VAASIYDKSVYKENGRNVYPIEYLFLQLRKWHTNYFEKGLSEGKIWEVS